MEDLTMYLSIGEKARECGVSVATLRRWDKRGLLKPDIITAGGHRRYKKKNKKMSSLPIILTCCSLISVPGLILTSPDLKSLFSCC